MKRLTAEIVIYQGFAKSPRMIPARVISNDMTVDGIYLFSQTPLEQGQEVAIHIKSPGSFYIKGRVISSLKMVSGERIISTVAHPYRIAVEFSFHNSSEKAIVKTYCEDLLRKGIFDQAL